MDLFNIIHASNPYADFEPTIPKADLQGWNGRHPALKRSVEEVEPSIIIDVGAWKGLSTSFLAKSAKELDLDTKVIAVDTWLGSPEHWSHTREDNIFAHLKTKNGYPQLYYTFLSNMVYAGVSDMVVPLPQTSDNAYVILKKKKIKADLIHIDAAHEYEPVLKDARNFWELLNPGGILIGDDYTWAGVAKAAHEFADSLGLEVEIDKPKWIIRKKKK